MTSIPMTPMSSSLVLPTAEDEAYPIRIAYDGTWYHQGSPIRRSALVRLFASVLRRDAAGAYWLVTPAERGRIVVEDAPFLAVEARFDGEGQDQCVDVRTNLEDWVPLGPAHRLWLAPSPVTGDRVPYVHLGGGIPARVTRALYYELVNYGGFERSGPAILGTAITGNKEPGNITPESIAYGQEEEPFGLWSRQTFFPLGSLSVPDTASVPDA